MANWRNSAPKSFKTAHLLRDAENEPKGGGEIGELANLGVRPVEAPSGPVQCAFCTKNIAPAEVSHTGPDNIHKACAQDYGMALAARCHDALHGKLAPPRPVISEPAIPETWSGETLALIREFRAWEPPSESFVLKPGIRILEPAQWKADMLADLDYGPHCPRARHGALQDDLSRWSLLLPDLDPEATAEAERNERLSLMNEETH